jgi:hypothetical protein
MRAFRQSLYKSPAPSSAVSIVMRECDLRVPFEEALATAREPLPGVFVFIDVFEGGGLEGTTAKAEHRRQAQIQRECDMAMCFYWNAGALRKLGERGVLSASRPAPLDADDLREVLRQLARHPAYRLGHTVLQIACDGTLVELRNGEVRS